MLRVAVLSLMLCAPLAAQSPGFGIKAGAVPRDPLTGRFDFLDDESKRYIVGPVLEIALPRGFAVEIDALYRRVGFTSYPELGTGLLRHRYHSWEFPILGKYRFGNGPVQPFAGAGYAPRVLLDGRVTGFYAFPSPVPDLPDVDITFDTEEDAIAAHGLLVAGGVEFRVGRIHAAPEIRYLRWGRFYEFTVGAIRNVSNRDEVQILLGVTWR